MYARQGLAIVGVGVVLALSGACDPILPEGEIGEARQSAENCQSPINGTGGCAGAGGAGGSGPTGPTGAGGMGGWSGVGGSGPTGPTGAGGMGGWSGVGGSGPTGPTGAGGMGGAGGLPGVGGIGGAMMICVPSSTCDDGNPCTNNDVCGQDGMTCMGVLKACDPAPPGSCVVPVAGTCNPATGLCLTAPAPPGTSCDDGNACTSGDACSGATCAGTSSCASSGPCDVAACDPQTGVCTHSAAVDGISCTLADVCEAGVCIGGVCTPDMGNPAICNQPGICQDPEGMCVPGQGCTYDAAMDGTPCGGASDPCTISTCQAGACASLPRQCTQPSDPCLAAFCDPQSADPQNPCTIAPAVGADCDDANPCTTNDVCAPDAQGATACGGVAQLDGVPCALAEEAGVCIAGTCFVSPEGGAGGSGGTAGVGAGPSGAGGGAGTGGAGGGPAPASSPQSVPIRLFGGGCAASGTGGDRRGAGLLGLVLLGLLAARRRATWGGS